MSTCPTDVPIYRLEDLCCAPNNHIVVADHANGLIVFDQSGNCVRHLNGDEDTVVFACAWQSSSNQLLSLVLDRPGWRLNRYDAEYKLVNKVDLPAPEEVPRLKFRWLNVSSDGVVLVCAGNFIWRLEDATDQWTMLHKDFRPEAWFSHIRKIPNSSGNRYLINFKGSNLQEVRLSEDGLATLKKDILGTKTIEELAAFTVDKLGHVLLADWATGNLYQSNDATFKKLTQIGSVGPNEPYVLCSPSVGTLIVGCKQSMEVRLIKY